MLCALEAAPHKVVAVRPLTTHQENYQRRTRHAGQYWRSRDELISDIFLWTPSHGRAKANDQLKPIYNSSMLIQDIALKTYREQWTIEKRSGRGSGRFALEAWTWGWWLVKSLFALWRTLWNTLVGLTHLSGCLLYFLCSYSWCNIIAEGFRFVYLAFRFS